MVDDLFDLLGVVHMYGFCQIEKAIAEHLREIVALKNICSILNAAR